MTEEFLHYAWQFQLFNQKELRTSSGEEIQVHSQGSINTNAGPDFFNAKINIGGTDWAGNVEIHINENDWQKHHHHSDAAYNNVILHVVFNAENQAFNSRGEPVPTLSLKDRVHTSVYGKYVNFQSNNLWIPCSNLIHQVDTFTIDNWLERLVVGRLERKSLTVHQMLSKYKNDWAQVFYTMLCKSLGFKVNAEPMDMLARTVPVSVLAKHKNNLTQLEAMLLGGAGFLEQNFEEEYPEHLSREWKLLQKKFSLNSMQKSLFKFSRLRPSNFPTIRIAQLAALIHQSSGLFSKLLESETIVDLKNLFTVSPSEYWVNHYVFDTRSTQREKQLGENSIHSILINAVVPVLFAYGQYKEEDHYKHKALDVLEALSAEKNAIIEKWKKLEITGRNAFRTQALLELKNEYCTRKKCLNCGIGNQILNK